MDGITFDCYFMTLCYLVALKSKDQNTKYGAVIVGPNKELRSTGYNSFIRGVNDNIPERQEAPEKYYHFEHAERNAIFNAARVGIPLEGCSIYIQGIPCADCARAIKQSGIKEVIIHKRWMEKSLGTKWDESNERSINLFKESGVDVRMYDGDIVNEIFGWRRGEKL